MRNIYCIIAILIGMLSVSGCSGNSDVIEASYDGGTSTEIYADVSGNGNEDDSGFKNREEGVGGITESGDDLLYVYVCGHVIKPGVYELHAGDRICKALECAGGVSDDAMPEALEQAKPVSDGETIYVPGIDEVADDNDHDDGNSDDVLININHADKNELMTLPGIGESKASDIIRYREEHGNFDSVEDLMQITGIKEGVFNKIKDMIKV